MLNKALAKHSDWAVFFLRLSVGIVFLVHGVGKLFSIGPFAAGITGVTGFFTQLGIPAPLFFAWVVAPVETLGGLFIILGLWVRLSALLLAIDMAVAILIAHVPSGFYASQGELALAMFLASIALLFSGAGKHLSLEKSIRG